MSNQELLGPDDKIVSKYLPDFAALGFVRNPMTSNLSCLNPNTFIPQNITQIGRAETALLQTDTVELVPGSLQTTIKFNDGIEFATGNRIDFQTSGEIRPAVGQSLTLKENIFMPDIIDSTATPLSNLISYNTLNGQLSFQPVPVDFRPTFTYFVAPNGNDTTGDGSESAPFATIQKAINEAELTASTTNRFLVSVAPGRYIENLTFTTGYVWVQGSGSSSNISTRISRIQGSISIAVGGADDLFDKVVAISGFQVIGSITDTSTAQHSTSITNCSLFNSNRCLYYNSSATTSRNAVYDCFINQDTGGSSTAVEITSGWLDIQRTPVNSNNNVSLMVVSGTGYLFRCVLCSFENGNASATLEPLVLISSTFATPHVFFNCSFLMTSATVKTGHPPSSAVRLTNAPTVSMSYCAISLAGTAHPQNHAVSRSAGTPTLLTYANACNQVVGTDRIQGGITIVALNTLT
jgi:hypothetical protein